MALNHLTSYRRHIYMSSNVDFGHSVLEIRARSGSL
jgi:hypothetical protein